MLKSICVNFLLIVISITLTLAGFELFLYAWEKIHTAQAQAAPVPSPSAGTEIQIPPEVIAAAKSRLEVLTMPEAWKRQPAEAPAASYAFYWQGVLHVNNEESFRWARPYPTKRDDTYRVMVVGDSLTYGDGLPEQWRFSNLLEQSMNRDFRIEFLNLGRSGSQSEDVLGIIKKYLPILRPNLVIYAVCLNDFLPSGVGQYETLMAYPFPLSDDIKLFFIRNTRSGAFMSQAYDAALRSLHLRTDFFDDILKDFDGYQQRFARDVADMNKTIRSAGLPPLTGVVVDQAPSYGSRGYKIAMIAEAALRQAGADVIPMEDFYRRYSDKRMIISIFEDHPNEIANIIWANMIAKELLKRADLQAFKR